MQESIVFRMIEILKMSVEIIETFFCIKEK